MKKFEDEKKAFAEARKAFTGKDLIDLAFEFQAYMTDEIVEAQKRLSEKNDFTFCGDDAANEAGHVANMVNQLRMVVYDIRTKCLGYQSEHGVAELRKCPHCGLIWTKVEGCEGDTTRGNRPNAVNDFRDPSYAELAPFRLNGLLLDLLILSRLAKKTYNRRRAKVLIMDAPSLLIGNKWQQSRFHLNSAKHSQSGNK